MENTFDLNFLKFSKDGYIDYEPERLTEPVIHEPFWWEELDWKYWGNLAHRNNVYPLIISGLYLGLVFGLQAAIKNRKPFILKKELALWNGALGVFSILGFTRAFQDFWPKFNQPGGLYLTLCVKDTLSMPMAFWAVMFVASKIVELGDTVFIVLRKRPLQMLQWYHHAVSLTLAWTTGPYMEPICKYYILMNYGVHSLMYPYFALRAMDVRIPRKLANVITFLQLAQMLMGVLINSYTCYLYYVHGSCHRHPFTIYTIWVAYGSFAILFGQLFYRLVIQKSDKKVA